MSDKIEFFISTSIISAEETYKAHKAKLKTLLGELRESAKIYFKETVSKLLEAHPILESFSWTQYTPYFCDGDPCEFGVNDLQQVNGDDAPNYSNYDYKTRKSTPKEGELNQACFAVHQLISSIEDTDMEAMFGDHVRVTATKEGITTEEYDHD